jgi:hypothetical protein
MIDDDDDDITDELIYDLAKMAHLARARAMGGGFAAVQGAADTTPAAFTFTDVTSAPLSTVHTSNTINVTGLTGNAVVSITGGTYSKNGGAYVSSDGTAFNGDTFSVRVTSSGSVSTAVNVILTIGGVSDTYTVTTLVNTEASTLILAMSAQAQARRLLIDNLITAGKANGWWTKLDIFYNYAAATQADALLNWKSPSTFTGTLSGSVTFTADQGVQRTTAASHITTGWDAATNGSQYTQNACGVYLYSGTAAVVTDYDFGDGGTFRFRVRDTGDSFVARIQSNTGSFTVASGITDGSGFFGVVRSGSGGTAVGYRRNTSNIALSGSNVSSGLTTTDFVLGRDGAAGVNGTATGRLYRMLGVGANLTTGQSDSFSTDYATYLAGL